MDDFETGAAEPQTETTADAAPLTIEEKVHEAVHGWLYEHIHGSAVSQATEAYNHLHGKLGELEAKIVQAVKE